MSISQHQLLRLVPDVNLTWTAVEKLQADRVPENQVSKEEVAQSVLLSRVSIDFAKLVLANPTFRELCDLPEEPEDLIWVE